MSANWDIPAHGWRPRDLQKGAWNYLMNGGKHAELIWHRRFGKDEIAMQAMCILMLEQPGTYWHMLPLQTQVRKAIWKAVNPHTGRRRIDDVFPDKYFKKNDSEMLVTSKVNASTWQCMGSDNFQGAIGSPPRGIVYSEWAQANPMARGYLRPIIAENDGVQLFITTPRGKNHAYKSFLQAQKEPGAYAEKLTIYDTKAVKPKELLKILDEYVAIYGEEYGVSLFEQEYECSFEAATIGTYYGGEFRSIDQEGRICSVPHDPTWPVHCAMDIGRTDSTCVWFWQNINGQPRVLFKWAESGRDADYVASVITGRKLSINIIGNKHDHGSRIEVEYHGGMDGFSHHQAYDIQSVWIPHDGAARTFAAKGKSVHEQLAAVFGWPKVKVVPSLSVQDGIQASRQFLRKCVIDKDIDTEGMRQYRREWDENMQRFRDKPLHDWASDEADGFRYMAIANRHDTIPKPKEPAKYVMDSTFNELVKANTKARKRRTA